MQQVGASLGLAVLVTVFGSASRDAVSSVPRGSSAVEQANYVFVSGAQSAFLVATALLLATLSVVAFAIRRRALPVA